ncbi:MAG: hypothetical protein KF784_14485 [Fimbriimonadaceae bacterium]|nr:hypothetical protein [Fimbriimonadaceae bacterium]
MKTKRTLKIVFGTLLIAVGGVTFWRFYDPMPDVPMPVREVKYVENYKALREEIQHIGAYSMDEVQFLNARSRNAESIKVGRAFVSLQTESLLRLREIIEKPFDAPLLTRHPTTETSGKAKSAGVHLGAKGILELIDGNTEEGYG